jgi:hypothetical protein
MIWVALTRSLHAGLLNEALQVVDGAARRTGLEQLLDQRSRLRVRTSPPGTGSRPLPISDTRMSPRARRTGASRRRD